MCHDVVSHSCENLTQAGQRHGNTVGFVPNCLEAILLRALTEPVIKGSLSFCDTRDEEPALSGTWLAGG